ncbi:serine/threonine-protein kinase [Sandaracinus amylolyticus]|uniref:Serine/threonine protein kinase n=1 Tax=Sandaracinus amylolyticus TaxID=927083 RepID=A0A0F6W5J5_9BACT|nr:serine/threonine-protein kinase [Sandaracinus amylolyticus]AKF07955.1 serine/threonine protein kinase [Sandaracinus amylolyticus]
MPALAQLVPGHVFARDFRILHLLAEGGMGAVYVVEQLSTGKRRALKAMLPQLVVDARARERFAQEARIAAHIESEHVVETVAAGIDEPTGLPWLAMELLEGRDLSHALRERGALPPSEVFEILQQLGDGLGAAHAKGIVHRDLKPENLFIAVSRRRGVPFTLKILDFGIAKLTQESRATASTTAAVGSPMWMAPEQTEQHARIRPATDVWALGLVAFYLLTGRSYWRVANHPEVRLTALFTEVLVTPLEPASVRAAQLGVGHLVPAGFDAWLARCLDRDPERRFPDARVALASLSPGLSLRDDAPHVPMTHEHRRVVPPTVAMTPSPVHPHAPTPYAPQGWAPHPHASTPYAVHSPSTATGSLPASRSTTTRSIALALGLVATLVGAGLSAFGGLVLWQRFAQREAPPPPRLVAHAQIDAGAQAQIDAGAHADAALAIADSGPVIVAPTAHDAGTHASRARSEVQRDPTPPGDDVTRFVWSEGARRRWRGTWSGQGWRYAITIALRRDGRDASGTIEWRLLETPRPDFQSRIGHQAEELVEGHYDEATGALDLAGYQSSDPTLVSTDHYDLRVAASGAISGRSQSDGGRVSARPAD